MPNSWQEWALVASGVVLLVLLCVLAWGYFKLRAERNRTREILLKSWADRMAQIRKENDPHEQPKEKTVDELARDLDRLLNP